ncbi:DUF4291 domain-containing protein [Chondrinema litorale]|uniref:DUF4291 domain-containing protein n=1 Tax=Chondrinema litorale TaxID=2994555 RepID=UPI002543006B|nr:DUF4291 domain-containing protein [Chondrinema litorale]UZR97167.1 DUF4291 domain-containing protein [Chondrinema litorale]
MQLENYQHQQSVLPKQGRYIIANSTDDTITVYQAFNEKIAEYAVKNQQFGGVHYSFSRMTWIKPNFMWMMYRSGWASKEGQERILAIEIEKDGFFELLKNSVISQFKGEFFESKEEWKKALKQSEVRLQWDPDHNPHGAKLERKAIQIGIQGKRLERFNTEWIKSISDITDFVHQQTKVLKTNSKDLEVPIERVVSLNHVKEIAEHVGIKLS